MGKRILHYLILAAILLGLPLLCCLLGGYDEILEGVKSFPPRTEDWGFHPEKLWNHRCPFNWWCFAGMMAFTLACVFPFVRRALRTLFASARSPDANQSIEQSEQSNNRTIRTIEQSNNRTIRTIRTIEQSNNRTIPLAPRFPWWGWLGVLMLAVSWTLSWNRFDWFRPYQVHGSYFPLWTGFILIMNALCVKRSGHSPLTDHPQAYLATFPASSLFWWFFEYLNRYVWNWYYLGIAELGALEYTFYATICFASVLPAVTAIAAWLHTFPAFRDEVYRGMARVDLRRPVWCAFLGVVALVGLTGIVFAPAYTYLLLWISPLTVFVLVQFLLREPSVLDSFKEGDWSVFFRFAVASLICGFCWETWNYYAVAKWVYAVPWVHRFQIWEMPLMGFAGYLPFGVECAAVTAWICPKLVSNEP